MKIESAYAKACEDSKVTSYYFTGLSVSNKNKKAEASSMLFCFRAVSGFCKKNTMVMIRIVYKLNTSIQADGKGVLGDT